MKNSKWLSAQELMERWQIKPVDLVGMLSHDSEDGLKYRGPCGGRGYFDLRDSWDPDGGQPEPESNPTIYIIAPQEKELPKLLFNKAIIEAYEQKHPELKPQDAPYVSSKGEIPPYLDKKHTHYSTELATSIAVWLQLFQSGAPIKNQSRTLVEQIKAALKEKGFTRSRESSRLATGINPDSNKRGGGTHTKNKATSKRTVKK
jgi:hypothetical protein